MVRSSPLRLPPFRSSMPRPQLLFAGASRRHLFLLPLLWVLVTAASPAAGQEAPADPSFSIALRGVPLARALEEVVNLTRIDLVYSSELVSGETTYCAARRLATEPLLRCVLAGTGLDFVRSSSGAYVLIRSVEEAPRFGNLAGRVVDAETGEPLPYANVLLADLQAGTATNGAGFFTFASLITGPHRVYVTYLGYETMVDSVWIGPGAEERIEIGLRPTELAIPPIVVSGLEHRVPSSLLGSGEVGGEALAALGRAPTPDVARAAASLPGLATQQPLADLHIQGGASGEHLILLDGVPVRDPVSLGRHLGAFSPLALGRLSVHKAGFGAAYGSHLSGLVEVEHDLSGGAPGLVVSADPLSLNARMTGDLPRQGAFLLALRQSAWDVYRDPGVTSLLDQWGTVDPILGSYWLKQNVRRGTLGLQRFRSDLSFSDLHAAMRLRTSGFGQLEASLYRSGNYVASRLAATTAAAPDSMRLVATYDEYDWENWSGQIRHGWLLGARTAVSLRLKGSHHESTYAYLAMHRATEPVGTIEELDVAAAGMEEQLRRSVASQERNRVVESAAELVVDHSFSPRHHLDAGASLSHVDSHFLVGNPFVKPFLSEVSAYELSGYADASIGLGLRAVVEPGVRLTYVPARQAVYAEPRLALRYDGVSRAGTYAVRLSSGLYRQFVNQFEMTSSASTAVVPSVVVWMPLDGSMAPPRALHTAAEVLLSPATGWTMRAEAYLKEQPRLLTVDYARLLTDQAGYTPPVAASMRQADFLAATAGRTTGVGVQLRREARAVTAEATYDYSRARMRFPGRFGGRMQPVPWNAPHRVSTHLDLRLGAGLSIGAGGEGIWGRRWALRRAYYDYVALHPASAYLATYAAEDPGSDALPPYLRLDAGLTYRRQVGGVDVQIRAAVLNVLDRANVYDRTLERTEDGRLIPLPRTLPGRQPALFVRIGL